MTRRLDAFCHTCELLVEYDPVLGSWMHVDPARDRALWLGWVSDNDHVPQVGWLSKLLVRRLTWQRRRFIRRWLNSRQRTRQGGPNHDR